MKRNTKIVICYGLLAITCALLYVYLNPGDAHVSLIVTGARKYYFSLTNITDQQWENRSHSAENVTENYSLKIPSVYEWPSNTSANHNESLELTYVPRPTEVVGSPHDPKEEESSSHSPENVEGSSQSPKEGEEESDSKPLRGDFQVIPLRDAEPSVFIEKMPKEFYHTDEGFDPTKGSKLKKILIWNEGYGTKTMGFGFGQAPFQLAKCEVDSCFTTGNRSLVPFREFDAVIFHFRATTPNDLPPLRYPHQRWIFEEVESSSYVYQDISVYNNLFNWTMTYRRDSDIIYTYGRVFAKEDQNSSRFDIDFAAGKTKMAAWFVSNCHAHSRREKFVKALQKHIQVDVYGKCGPNKCPHSDGKKCCKLLENEYRFYLSFENSICKDYVTEKLFGILKYNIIPVVYGLGDYDHIVPPGSYINALKFPDVQSLAEYMKYLAGNDTAYNEYFRWKGHYAIDNGWTNTAQPFCELCKKLHEDHTPKVYPDMKQWFITKGSCKTLRIKDWLKNLK